MPRPREDRNGHVNGFANGIFDADEDRGVGFRRASDGCGNMVWEAAPTPVKAGTPNQQTYLDAMRRNRLVFCGGPAGTGKTLLAAGTAAGMLRAGEIERIICMRPAVEAGERIGFTPGTAEEKLDPYVRPILEQLAKFFTASELREHRKGDRPTIVVQPLGYVRGLTFDESFVLLDEAQNATQAQIWNVITRIGRDTKLVVNGSPNQCDLPPGAQGGFAYYSNLWDMPGVETVTLTTDDILRDPFLKRLIVEAEKMGHHAA